MNRHLTGIALGASLAFAIPAHAVELTGAEVGASHSFFVDDTSVSKTTLQGSAELGFGPMFGVQGDLGINWLNESDETATSATLHGLYHVNDQTSLGLFYGSDKLDGEHRDYYGFEVGQKGPSFDVEAYVGRGEDSGLTGTMMGVEGRFAVSGAFGLGGKLQNADFDDDASMTRVGLTGDYTMPNGMGLTAELGRLNSDGLGVGDETYVGIGAKMSFGPNQGVTFGKRGLLDVLPGL
ncbi:hypothetical protein FAZ78_09225 [Cereibacter changlensis]|uniref:Porin domain-containing protein n=2 Tax=Cereibacter changlensis TaxID=402884 RepID=A0A2T4JW58_9RHOB|nr:hypothetical protein [Cereibacter changlensis]PTE22149.1 hypothetical protein C5F48_08510 [Cereibacter changlensis JA139]PZX58663.1 hypothetical protein LX76_00165 [Cereibacter changlensis]TKA96851.1 hypothetical protein FAZ78_09225 [Cereibacter changlensis]